MKICLDKPNVILNQVSLLLLTLPFLFTPAHSLNKMIFLLGVLGLWFISTLSIDKNWLKKRINIILLIMVFFLLDGLYSIFHSDFSFLRFFLTQKLFVYIWLLILCFYIDRINLLQLLIKIILVMVAISCLYTIYSNLVNPESSRILATGIASKSTDLAKEMNTGGYGFIYGITFLIMPMILLIRNNPSKAILYIIVLLIILITILTAAYMTGILIAIGLLLSGFISSENKFRFTFLIIIATILLIVYRVTILNFIIDIGKDIDSYMLVRRATQLRDLTYFSDYGNSDYNRLVRYKNGIINFINHPFLGRMFGDYSNLLNAGHSALINYFDTYGIFGIFYIFYWRDLYVIVSKKLSNKLLKYSFNIYYVYLLLFLITDVIDTAQTTALCTILLSPVIFVIVNERNKYEFSTKKVIADV